MSGKKLVLLLTAALFAATLWGCGSNRDSGDSVVPEGTGGTGGDEIVNAQVIGIDNCAQCHATYNQAWLEGRHANANGSPGGPHLPATDRVSCGNCHNQLEQAGLMPLAYPGEFQRDVITCESCHGGGSAHRGIGPIPYAKPGVDRCAQCHAELDEETGEYVDLRSRSGHDDGATTAVTGYLKSGHADAPRDLSSRSGTVGCNRCHSDEGAKLYRNLNDIDAITDADGRGRGAMPLGEENISSIQCRTCHDTHNVGGASLLMPGTETTSAQYDTCTHCHADNDDLNYHTGHARDGLLDREILDTHYDDPTTAGVLEGYVIRADQDSACSDCHDVHSADLTINTQWANSGHGAEILEFKKQAGADSGFEPETEEYTAAIVEAGMLEEDAPAFMHGGWSTACQRCHTSTGASNFLDDPVNYDPANNDFSHFASGAQDGAQDEMIYCWACHSDAGAGELRTPGAIVTDYGVTMPNMANSNGCIACHAGRSGGGSITGDETRFPNSHYLPAAGVLFSGSGYEFNVDPDGDPATDDAYANKSYFKHDKVGAVEVVDIVDHGEVVGQEVVGAGPCVGCHMNEETGHTFAPILTDAEGSVTLPAVCSSCHNTTDPAGSHYFSGEILLEERHEFHSTVEMLGGALAAAGMPYLGSYPYFNIPTDFGTYEKAKLIGSAFNFNMLHHEPGAYAHNRYYAKRLLFDSLDFLVDGSNDMTLDLNALDAWIVANATAEQLSTAGYDAEDLAAVATWLGADENNVSSRP